MWHYRDVFKFFFEKNDEWEFEADNWDEFLVDEPIFRLILDRFRYIPLPDAFKKGYSEPMFKIMFPRSRTENTLYSLQADLYNFHNRLKSDYELYKALKNYLVTSLNKIKNIRELIKPLDSQFKDLPKHLELTDIYDAYTPVNKTSDNPLYSKLIDVFYKFDLAGYKSDSNFNNMFDDALHTFYAAHFDYFITNDERCNYKAKKTYSKLNISTKVIKIGELNDLITILSA